MRFHSVPYNGVLTSGFVIALIAAFALRMQPLAMAYLASAILLVLANVRVLSDIAVKERTAAAVLVVALTLMLPISTIRSQTAVAHYMSSIVSLGAALVLTRDPETYLKASRYSLAIAQLAVLAFLSRTGITGFPLENILPDSSSNGVTSYMILLQANYCVINFLMTRRASLVTAFATLFICFVGWGRGSLLAAIGIVAVGLLTKTRSATHYRGLLRLIVVGGLGVVAAIAYSPAIDTLVAGTKIGSGIYDVSRVTMIREYLSTIDAATVWTGADYAGTIVATEFNGNPHNSFIRAHHIFGLPYLVVVLLLPIYLIDRRHSLVVKSYAAAMWIIVLFRSFTEPVLFPTFLDFFYFSIAFLLSRAPAAATRQT